MKRPGFTLLELLLALALVVVVLGLLGIAVNVHLRVADATRNEVEQSQSARLALRRLADDLRNAIPVTRAPSSIGCLLGTREELQIEVSHMPLLDDLQASASPLDNALPASPPSDVRTITYFVAKPEEMQSPETSGLQERKFGLMRREWERATFAWAMQQSQTADVNRGLTVLSPEVEAIEFTYLDGSTEYQEWDSVEKGKLPTAVNITIAIRQPWSKAQKLSARGTIEPSATIFSALVDLPNARATLDQAIAASTEPTASTSQPVPSSDSTGQETKSQGAGIKEIKPIESISGGSGK
jgi:prepilin-type N-terminal cleavage/methylation domain-containing protein